MDGETQVVVGGERERLIIAVLGRMHPGCTDYWDGNWLLSPIDVSIGGFSGHVDAGLRAEELRSFREGLEKLSETLAGEAVLESMEDWIGLTCLGDGRGHIKVSGYVRDEPGIGNQLSFELSIDQTFLPAIIASLREVEHCFSVIGKP